MRDQAMNLSLGTVIVYLCLVCVLTKSFDIWKDRRRMGHEDQYECYHLLTNSLRSLPLWSANGRYTACLFEINVESAISLTVHVRARGKMTSSIRAQIAFYDQHPGMSRSRPLAVWSSEDATLIKRFEGYRLWVWVTSLSSASDGEDIVLDYAADTMSVIHACFPISDFKKRFGKIQFHGSNLGSKAQLVCDKGYILTNGSGSLECVVSSGQLVWTGDGSTCESVCKHPKPVVHGTYSFRHRPIRDKHFSSTDPSHNPLVNSIVRYACDHGYQLIGNKVSHCQHNDHGVPEWSSDPPVCRPLDCRQTQVLNATAGHIVSPKSSTGVLQGGSLNCSWEVSADGHDVLIRVLRSDLPLEDDVALEISEPGSNKMLRLTGKSSEERHIFRSVSLGVAVTYHGPKHDMPNHTGIVLEYSIVPRIFRLRRAAFSSDATAADSISIGTASTQAPLGDSSYQTVAGSSHTTTDQQTAVQSSVNSQMSPSSMDIALNPVETSATDITADQSSQPEALLSPTAPYPLVGTASDSPYARTTLAGDVDTTSGIVVSDRTAGVDNTSMHWNASLATDTTSGVLYDNLTGDVPSSLITSGTDELTGVYGVTASADSPEESDDGWKIALGITMPLIGIGLILLVGYIVYRKKYPVRMIIGREFAKFSNPVYARSKHAPSLVRDDAEDYFSSRASSSVNLDEMNPVNQNIHYNAAFVSEEDEEDKRFIEQKAWLFAKTANGSTSRPMSEITLCSNDSTGSAAAKIDSTDSLEMEIDKLLGQQKRTPRVKPKRKKLQSRSSSSSVETLSETTSATDSVDLPEGPMRSSGTLSEGQETAPETPLDESTVSSSLGSELNKESTYMKLSKIILEQPTFEEVCAEARLRSRSLSIDRNVPEKRMRSYSVDPFKSARRSSLMNDELLAPESAKFTGYSSILAKAISTEMLCESTASITSIISETSIIDESMLDGLADVAKERCLSMTSQNSNQHLVTDLDEVSVGGNSHWSDVNTEDAPKPVKPVDEHSEFVEITSTFPKDEEHGEIVLDKAIDLQYDEATVQLAEKGEDKDQFFTKAGDHLHEAGHHSEYGGDSQEQSESNRSALADEEPGKTRVVRFDSVQGSDDGQDQGHRWSSRTLSTTSRGSSMSVSSGVSVSTATSSDSDDTGSYSFNNEGSKQSVEVVSEEESEDDRFPHSPSHSPTPTPLTDEQVSIPLSPSAAAEAFSPPYFRSPSTEKSSEIPKKSLIISELDLSESSSDSSDVEKQSGIAPQSSPIRHLPRQESVFSSGDEDNGATSLTIDDIALVLDDDSETDQHANGSLKLDQPSAGNSDDSTKQKTLTLTDVIVEDDIEV